MSKPKILADENIESSLIKFLKGKGFDVKCASKGLRNSELLAIAEREGRILLTHDHDFLRIESYRPVNGTLVLAIYPLTEIEDIMLKFFKRFEFDEIRGKAFLLTKDKVLIFSEEKDESSVVKF
ncbi:MAG: DUF5615 family PIN-like protein [Thermoproteota archaeon]